MLAPPNVALRRFTAVWALTIAVKIAAFAVLFLVVLKFLGGS